MIGQLVNDEWHLPTIIYKSRSNKEIQHTIAIRMKKDGKQINFDLNLINDDTLTGSYIVKNKYTSSSDFKKSVEKEVTSGKNKGKKNATNAIQQTIKEALAEYNKKNRKDYMKPMLAKIKTKPIVDKFVFVQRKYNGLRAIYDTKQQKMFSRKGKEYNVPDIINNLKSIDYFENVIYIDGELYNSDLSLQSINSAARNFKKASETIKLTYYIYDIVFDTNKLYEQRLAILNEIFNQRFDNLKIVETIKIDNNIEEQIDKYFNQFIDEKYEGLMVRLNENYEFSENDYHSNYLLKVKNYLDAEFKVVGFSAKTTKKTANAIIFKCVTKDNKEFDVIPSLSIKERVELYEKSKISFDYLNKYIIVKYEEMSEEGIPLRTTSNLEIRTWD